jgi:hypothetical protein
LLPASGTSERAGEGDFRIEAAHACRALSRPLSSKMYYIKGIYANFTLHVTHPIKIWEKNPNFHKLHLRIGGGEK